MGRGPHNPCWANQKLPNSSNAVTVINYFKMLFLVSEYSWFGQLKTASFFALQSREMLIWWLHSGGNCYMWCLNPDLVSTCTAHFSSLCSDATLSYSVAQLSVAFKARTRKRVLAPEEARLWEWQLACPRCLHLLPGLAPESPAPPVALEQRKWKQSCRSTLRPSHQHIQTGTAQHWGLANNKLWECGTDHMITQKGIMTL